MLYLVSLPPYLEIIVVLPKWIDQGLCHFQPTHVEKKLQKSEPRDNKIDLMTGVIFCLENRSIEVIKDLTGSVKCENIYFDFFFLLSFRLEKILCLDVFF